jgi:hypothetical protein
MLLEQPTKVLRVSLARAAPLYPFPDYDTPSTTITRGALTRIAGHNERSPSVKKDDFTKLNTFLNSLILPIESVLPQYQEQ